MTSFFNKHKNIIFTITVLVFVLGVFFGLGAYIGNISVANTIAKVGKGKIPYDRYEMEVRATVENITRDKQIPEANDVIDKMVRQEVFKEMIVNELFYQEAKKFNMGVSNYEVAVEIENTPNFASGGRFDPRAYVSQIWSTYKMTPKDYEDWRKKERTAMHLKQFLYSTIKITPDEEKFYEGIFSRQIKDISKDREKFMAGLKQEKFLEVANYYLRQLTSKVEIQDFRKKFEKQETNS
ncbi:MAG: SurA N-terminal domain-containing protein [Elusimicrobiales bacterium]|nr:SurA N-terminal domain-containing protein [Elusimicrobiales bacterium]